MFFSYGSGYPNWGYRIIKAVGRYGQVEKHQGFSADLAAVISLFIASIFGLPVSTTHVKTTAIMGVGAAKIYQGLNGDLLKTLLVHGY